MGQIIAATYEIEKEIGAGGGGVVYLSKHLRLDKQVVLKADRRTLVKTKPEVLRQEVDVLKNLSHSYIPQVYDFFVEQDTVYTVMDYIAGESFDKPLKRGERFPQAQVIVWACQLLEALCYLHSRPPYGILHADIKPANVMLTPENDIRLIDFNIALALGAEGAVKVGYSRGYASPEHYTAMAQSVQAETQLLEQGTTLLVDDPDATETLPQMAIKPETPSSSSSGRGGRLLDVRSDIYSLGATLYHILTGVRPAEKASEVVPISGADYSPAVIAIIQKAMAPDPDQRYQTAEAMLYDFQHLHEQDGRTVQYKRRVRMTAAILAVAFLCGSVASFTGLKQMEQQKNASMLAAYSEDALQNGDVAQAISYALEALPSSGGLFQPPYTAQAQKALTDALGVYDLSDGFKAQGTVTLPSEPLQVVIAPDGVMAAALYAYEILVFDTQTSEPLATLESTPSALAKMCFLDSQRLAYAGLDGIAVYDIAQQKTLWQGGQATNLAVSADGGTVAAVYKDDTFATIYDAQTGAVKQTVSFGDKKQSMPVNDVFADDGGRLLSLNQDGTLLAVGFSDGGLMVYDTRNADNTVEVYATSKYTAFDGGFSGPYFAYAASNSTEAVFSVLDLQQYIVVGGFTAERPFVMQADETGIYVAADHLLVAIDPVLGTQTELAYPNADIIAFTTSNSYTLAATADKGYRFFDSAANQLSKETLGFSCDFVRLAGDVALIGSRDTPVLRLLKLEQHPDQQLFHYDPSYPHDEARISADGKTVMLFRYDQFRLYQIADGSLIKQVALPNAKQVYDQQYRRQGHDAWLEVLYYDGIVRKYSVQDGSLLSEEQGTPPDKSLTEEFWTERYHIVAPLHETPVVYDRDSEKKVCELDADAYLTYVTQVDAYIITEYITADGQRYGVLLNEDCQPLALLPNLCDIVGEELIFDYPSGDLRKSKLYALPELLTLARTKT